MLKVFINGESGKMGSSIIKLIDDDDSFIKVQKGDYVSTGENIGNVSPNSSNEYILHFEVWKDGKNINPKDWLIKK